MTFLRIGTTGLLLATLLPCLAGGRMAKAITFAPFQTGNVQTSSLSEASGLAASRKNPNVLWTMNDSGASAKLYAMTAQGDNLGTYSVDKASNKDWEDIAVGPGPVDGQQYLYVGDIGDNSRSRSSVVVYRMPEPTVSDTQVNAKATITGATKFTFKYPDGKRDAESLFVDPQTKDIYIISKRDAIERVYRAPYPQNPAVTTTMELVATFASSVWITAGDISPDGNQIIIRSNEGTTGRLFTRPVGGTIADAFNNPSVSIPIKIEKQGEAIAFDPNGRGYFTTSEGKKQPIHYFDLVPPPSAAIYWDNDGKTAGTYQATGQGMGGSGEWNTSTAKWYNGVANTPWQGGNQAVFWGTAGTVTLSGTQTAGGITFKSNNYLLTGGTLQLAWPTIQVDSGVSARIDSIIAGTSGLTKNGDGTLRLGGINSFTGGTTVTAGKLLAVNTTGSATGGGAVAVNFGATLGGTGFVQGNVTNGGFVAPGDEVGSLHLGGTFEQSAAGALQIELASASYDSLVVDGSASLAGSLAVSLIGGFAPQLGNVFSILTASDLAGTTFDSASLPALASGLAWDLQYGTSSVSLQVVASSPSPAMAPAFVPEPSTVLLAIIGAFFAGAGSRRRRSV